MAKCSRCSSTRLQLLYHNSDIYYVYKCQDCNRVDDIFIDEGKIIPNDYSINSIH